MRKTWIYGGLALAASLLSLGCQGEAGEKVPIGIEKTLRWEGRLADVYEKTSSSALRLEDSSNAVLVTHSLLFHTQDSVRLNLTEYPKDYLAFAAFQTRASKEQIREGVILLDTTTLFFHGPFLGEIAFQRGGRMDLEDLRTKLSFHGEDLFLLPRVFLSFPLAQRIPFSERVNTVHFLGHPLSNPIFSVLYAHQGDTSVSFRLISNSREADSIQAAFTKVQTLFPEPGETLYLGSTDLKRPLVFWKFKEGAIGMEGSFNQNFTLENLKKMKKMTLLLKKP